MEKSEVLNVIAASKCIIDINHPQQTGLTMRTLEIVGAKRKLITTNMDILNYDFYHPNNILLIDRNNPVLDDHFLNKEYKEMDETIYEKYSLSAWLNELFLM